MNCPFFFPLSNIFKKCEWKFVKRVKSFLKKSTPPHPHKIHFFFSSFSRSRPKIFQIHPQPLCRFFKKSFSSRVSTNILKEKKPNGFTFSEKISKFWAFENSLNKLLIKLLKIIRYFPEIKIGVWTKQILFYLIYYKYKRSLIIEILNFENLLSLITKSCLTRLWFRCNHS